MNIYYNYANTLQKAASLATGIRLNPLQRICEQQNTISTRKLVAHLDYLREGMQQDAVHFRALADRIAKTDWIAFDTPEDIEIKGQEILLWDGADYHIDYVDVDAHSGNFYLAGGTEATYWKPLTPP